MVDPWLFAEYTRRTGEIICQICCESKAPEQLEPVSDEPGTMWDVCRECAAREREHGARY